MQRWRRVSPRPWDSGRSARGGGWGSHVVSQQEQTLGIRLCVGGRGRKTAAGFFHLTSVSRTLIMLLVQ